MTDICTACLSFLNKKKLLRRTDLKRSFTKINGQLHLGFNSPTVCQAMASYIPDTIIFAGNGAVELLDGRSCSDVLTSELPSNLAEHYPDLTTALSWITAHHNLFNHTVNPQQAQEKLMEYKRKIIGALHTKEIVSRKLFCSACQKEHCIPNNTNTLILTTNWDLGLWKKHANVIQLHGRCDYPEQAVLPLHDISSLMIKDLADLKKLNSGFLPGTFLEKCLRQVKSLIVWGTALNDYDATLWFFLDDFLRENTNLRISIACNKDNASSFDNAQKKISKFFPSIPIHKCLCHMLN